MELTFLMLLGTSFLGAAVQAGIGIGFSIVVGPLAMLTLGSNAAVPTLLLLNIVVSAVACTTLRERGEVRLLLLMGAFTALGVAVGALLLPFFSDWATLLVAAVMLALGLMATIILRSGAHRWSGCGMALAAGAATVWAAMPGPLTALALSVGGLDPRRLRAVIHPLSLVLYTFALLPHLPRAGPATVTVPGIWPFLAVTATGALAGRLAGPALPARAIVLGVRLIATIALLALILRLLRAA